jgi:hypothetical protein
MKPARGRKISGQLSPQELVYAGHIAQLEQEVQQLDNENKRLILKQNIFLGLCVAAGLAVDLLRQLFHERDSLAVAEGKAAAYPALWELELARYDHPIELVLQNSPEVASLLANSLPQLPLPLPGCCRELLSRFFKDESGTSCASMLDGGPMSLLVAGSVCMISDPDIVSTAYQYKNRVDVHNEHCSMQPPMKLLLQLYDAAQDPSSRNIMLRDMAIVYQASCIKQLGARVVKPEVIYGGDRGQANLVPDSLLDALTEVIGLQQEQLETIIAGLEIFHEMQAPYAKQKAAISKRMAELLQKHQPACAPSSACLGAAQAWQAPGRTPGKSAGAGQGTGASPLAAKPCNDLVDGIEGKMALLGLSDHETLSSLADQLAKVNAKTTWLDGWSFTFVMGQLSWLQVST